MQFTGSPTAARLLVRRGALPLVRVQPVHFQGTIEATWCPVLERCKEPEMPLGVTPGAEPQQPEAAMHV